MSERQRPWQISRRTMLRGVGAMMALPLLEAMGDAAGAFSAKATLAAPGTAPASAFPVRMAVLYMPNGVNEQAWAPAGTGKGFELSPTLSPLADLKSEIL